MAIAKVTVHPYVTLDLKGNLVGTYTSAWKTEDSVTDSYIHMGLPPVEIEVVIPGEAAMRQAAVQLIDARMLDARAKFMAQQTLMQGVKNDLLRLEHADVLDAAPKTPQMPERDLSRCVHCMQPKSKHYTFDGDANSYCTDDRGTSNTFEEDDIPF